jgi:hypothetical protein
MYVINGVSQSACTGWYIDHNNMHTVNNIKLGRQLAISRSPGLLTPYNLVTVRGLTEPFKIENFLQVDLVYFCEFSIG